jgi:hypothetical protein
MGKRKGEKEGRKEGEKIVAEQDGWIRLFIITGEVDHRHTGARLLERMLERTHAPFQHCQKSPK